MECFQACLNALHPWQKWGDLGSPGLGFSFICRPPTLCHLLVKMVSSEQHLGPGLS